MGSDLASVLWDVLDGYNFYKTFKTAAIGNDRRGLPKPVNRSLFFDSDSEEHGDELISESDSSKSQRGVNSTNSICWRSLKDFLVSNGNKVKDSFVVCTNSTLFFLGKVFNASCTQLILKSWTLFVVLILTTAGSILLLEYIMIAGGTLYNAVPCSERDLKNSDEESESYNRENLTETIAHRCRSEAGNSDINLSTLKWEMIELRNRLNENELTYSRQSEIQRRSTEALKQQIHFLGKLFPEKEVFSEEGLWNELEYWQENISNITRQTESAVSTFQKEAKDKLLGLASRTSLINSIESKIAKLAEEFVTMKRNIINEISDLQILAEGISQKYAKPEESSSLGLTVADVRAIVKQEEEKKAGKVNWITRVSSHSPTHKGSFFSIPSLSNTRRSPETTITMRNCWPMNGANGFIQYELVGQVLVQTLAIEHLHKSRRVIMGSVPKDFRVDGSPDGGKTWLNLGKNTYDTDGPAVQYFNIEQTSEPLKTIRLSILSNYGEQYTCLYGVAVYGKRST